MVNHSIRAEKVLLIDQDGVKQGVLTFEEAMARAEAEKADLVMVGQGETPVCKILDYNKWRFEQKRKKQTKKQSKTVVKEIKLRPVIDEGDFKIKLKQIRAFIADGCRVKIMIRFKGREISHQEIGEKLVERLLMSLSGEVNVDQLPKLDGRQIVFTLVSTK